LRHVIDKDFEQGRDWMELVFRRPMIRDAKFTEHRDLMVLHWLGEQFAARYDHLEMLIDRGNGPVGILVGRLRRARYVRTTKLLVAERMWVVPTSAGLRQCGLTYGAAPLRTMSLAHIAAINDVRLHVQSVTPQAYWISERRLVLEGPSGVHVPDGVALYDGRRIAVEVELNTKAAHIVQAKLDQLSVRFDAVFYFCAPRPYRQLARLAESGRWPQLHVRELPRPSPSRLFDA
jgi:hypothetical protein